MSDIDDGKLAIIANNLVKTFTVSEQAAGVRGAVRSLIRPRKYSRTVVDRISFEVGYGELVGLLGPNGAGKSTTIKLLTGIMAPTSGSVAVNGIDPHRFRTQNAANIGAVFGQRTQLWWDLPALESFSLLKDIYGLSRPEYRTSLDEFDSLLGLSKFWGIPARYLSLGQRVRCDLAAALLHDPRVIFLDEPTIGMDVLGKEQVRRFLLHLVGKGRHAIVLTTHDMSDIERLCRRTMLVANGRMVFDGSLAELRQESRVTHLVAVEFSNHVPLPSVEGAELVHTDGRRAQFRVSGSLRPEAVIESLFMRYPVADAAIEESSLEDLLRERYQVESG